MSLHSNFFSQICRDVEIFTFDNSWLAFFKATTVDRLELQDFLFLLHLFFGGPFFLPCGRRFSSRRAHRRLGCVENLKRVRGWFDRWCRRSFDFSKTGLLNRSCLRGLKIFDRRRLGLDLNLGRGLLRLFPHWRHWRRAAERRLSLR